MSEIYRMADGEMCLEKEKQENRGKDQRMGL